MDRTLVKKTMTRRPRASGAEPRRDKTTRRSGRAGDRRAAGRVSTRPVSDQLGNELEVTGLPEVVDAGAARVATDVDDVLPGMELELAGKDVEVPGAIEPLAEADVVDEEALVAPAAGALEEDDLDLGGAAAAGTDIDESEGSEGSEGSDDQEEAPRAAAADGAEDEEGPTSERKQGQESDEPQSFLAMYFRDMAELDVLRPEQEFETARKIEELELDLWRALLGFAPGATWMADTIEKAMEHPLPDLKPYRALGERAKRRAAPARGRADKLVDQLAVRLKEQDIDRIFVDAAVAEVQRVSRAARTGHPVDGVGFSTATKSFREFAQTVRGKALRVKQAKNEFVKANLRLVVSIARRFNHGRLPLPDLIQEGNIGLMKAVERYDYRRGFRFSTYASWWIRHAISRALADKGRAVRLPVHMIDAYHRIAKSERELQSKLERPATTEEIASATGIEADKLEKMKTFLSETPVSLDRPISDEDGRRLIDVLVDPNEAPSPPDQMMTSETQREMLKLLGGLKPIEADILRKRFGLVNDRERTLKEIGDEYHLSRERVRQLQEQALGKMRKAMAKREIL
jgi:RNA polymerase primary sigma factor